MNKTVDEAVELVDALKPLVGSAACQVLVCPPFTALYAVARALRGTDIELGAQNLFWKPAGAYTGQVSAAMLRELGCDWVVIGHSESRGRFGVADPEMTPDLLRVFGDNDATVNAKARSALQRGLRPILCCGELLEEREAGRTDAVVADQVRRAIAGLAADQSHRLVLAYEPVWAIGTGQVCGTEEANRVCGLIRQTVAGAFGQAAADAVRIQYGGSVSPKNADDLLKQPEIDGALVGGASLKAEDFAAIVAAAG